MAAADGEVGRRGEEAAVRQGKGEEVEEATGDIAVVVEDAENEGATESDAEADRLPSAMGWWWMYRGLFGLQVVALAAIIYGLTRPRVVALYSTDEEPDQAA